MSDTQTIVDEVRFQVQSDYCQLSDEIERLASDYASLCSDANSRLRRCGEFLNRGLVSEALHHSESDPNLLDQVAVLDFSELSEWREIVTLYDLKQPEPLMLEIAEELNDSYAMHEPLKNLMDKHRLLALSVAPIHDRLEVLRILLEKDSSNHFWNEDIRDLEKARFEQIQILMTNNSGQKPGSRELSDIQQELSRSDWIEPVPSELLTKIRRETKKSMVLHSREKLSHLDEELAEAFARLDLQKARELRTEWVKHVKIAQLDPQHELLQRNAPIVGWVEDEDKSESVEKAFEQGKQDLESALADHDTTSHELRHLYHRVASLGKDIPDSLQSHFNNKVSTIELTHNRRRMLQIGSGIGLIAVVIALFIFMVNAGAKHREQEEIIASAQKYLDEGELVRAREMVDSYADYSPTESWLALQKILADAEKKDTERATKFLGMLSNARSGLHYDQAIEILENARDIAATPEEMLSVATLEEELRSKRQAERMKLENSYTQQLGLLSDNLDSINNLLKQKTASKELSRLDEESIRMIADLRSKKNQIRTELSSQLDLLMSRHRSLKSQLLKDIENFKLLEILKEYSSQLGNPQNQFLGLTKYTDALQALAKNNAENSMGAQYQTSSKESDLWKGVLAWNHALKRWPELETQDLKEAVSRNQECLKLINDYPDSPTTKAVQKYSEYLSPMTTLAGDESSPFSDLESMFNNKVFKNIYYLKYQDDDKTWLYYLTTPQKINKSVQQDKVRYITDMSNGTSFATADLPVKYLEHDVAKLAPHCQIAKYAQLIFTTRGLKDSHNIKVWHDSLKDITTRIISQEDLDPFFRYILLKIVLEVGAEGSASLRLSMKDVLEDLEDEQINLLAKWMDPTDDSAIQSRTRAETIMKDNRIAEKMKTAWDQLPDQTSALLDGLDDRFMPIGWLSSGADSKYDIISSIEPEEYDGCSLHVITPHTKEDAAYFNLIGHATADEWRLLQSPPTEGAVVGRVIFAKSLPHR